MHRNMSPGMSNGKQDKKIIIKFVGVFKYKFSIKNLYVNPIA